MSFTTAEIIKSKTTVTDSEAKTKKNTVSDTVDYLANMIVEKLQNPDRRAYYCKVAYRLSEAQIINNLEVASRGRDPQRYFTWLCQKDMGQ